VVAQRATGLHRQCVEQRLRNRWNGPVIAFQFLDCPLCAKPINHASVAELLKVARKFKDTVEAKIRDLIKRSVELLPGNRQ
jgi:hypothetical protein